LFFCSMHVQQLEREREVIQLVGHRPSVDYLLGHMLEKVLNPLSSFSELTIKFTNTTKRIFLIWKDILYLKPVTFCKKLAIL